MVNSKNQLQLNKLINQQRQAKKMLKNQHQENNQFKKTLGKCLQENNINDGKLENKSLTNVRTLKNNDLSDNNEEIKENLLISEEKTKNEIYINDVTPFLMAQDNLQNLEISDKPEEQSNNMDKILDVQNIYGKKLGLNKTENRPLEDIDIEIKFVPEEKMLNQKITNRENALAEANLIQKYLSNNNHISVKESDKNLDLKVLNMENQGTKEVGLFTEKQEHDTILENPIIRNESIGYPIESSVEVIENPKNQENQLLEMYRNKNIENLATKIIEKFNQGTRKFEFQLTPKELGSIKIEIVFDKNQTKLAMFTSNKKAYDILATKTDILKDILQGHSQGSNLLEEESQLFTRDRDNFNEERRQQFNQKQKKHNRKVAGATSFEQRLRLGLIENFG